MKIHMRQSLNCSFVQKLNKKETSTNILIVEDSTSTEFVSINYIVFSSQILYLIIENLYHKQQILLAKTEDLTVIEAKKTAIVVQEVVESKVDVVVNFELKIKIKSFKFEKFTINFSSTSTISCFESIIKSNVVFVANSIFISVSESANSTSLRSISFCSTSTILLINQSSYLLVANQFVAHISYQYIVMTFFFSYEK